MGSIIISLVIFWCYVFQRVLYCFLKIFCHCSIFFFLSVVVSSICFLLPAAILYIPFHGLFAGARVQNFFHVSYFSLFIFCTYSALTVLYCSFLVLLGLYSLSFFDTSFCVRSPFFSALCGYVSTTELICIVLAFCPYWYSLFA